MSRFSVAPTLGYSSTTSAPTQLDRPDRRSRRARARTRRRAPRGSRGACRSDGTRSRRRPASRPGPRPPTASNGPSTALDARNALDQFVRRLGHHVGPADDLERPVLPATGREAHRLEQRAHVGHVGDVGHVPQDVATLGEHARRHQLERRVLGPADRDLAGSGPTDGRGGGTRRPVWRPGPVRSTERPCGRWDPGRLPDGDQGTGMGRTHRIFETDGRGSQTGCAARDDVLAPRDAPSGSAPTGPRRAATRTRPSSTVAGRARSGATDGPSSGRAIGSDRAADASRPIGSPSDRLDDRGPVLGLDLRAAGSAR